MNNTPMQRKNRRGFSLIELMVVIVIIGILGTAGYFVYTGLVGDSKAAVAKSEIESLKNGVVQYKLKKQQYPNSLDDLKSMENEGGVKLTDPWGRPYEYYADEEKFTISSQGEKTSTDDDNLLYDSREGWLQTGEKKE